ncbi:MAG TPA: hypothetical protein VGR48_09640 [Terriglobales bacterium]|nr:hypothetical protein [Terriglobales bacterium]
MDRLLRCAVLIILAAMLAGHVTELFDHWDHTLRTGREADYTLVVLAACAGLEVVIARSLVTFFRGLRGIESSAAEQPFSTFWTIFSEIPVAGPSPPLLLTLRI